MTLTQRREIVRREIVRRFKAGESIVYMMVDFDSTRAEIEQILRDFINGKFTLKAKRKARR